MMLALSNGVGSVTSLAEASQVAGAAQRAAAQASKRAAEQAAKRAAVKSSKSGASASAKKSVIPDKVIGTYSTPLCKPSAPCPLPEHVSNTFVGSYQKKILSQDTVLYRVYTDPARTLGAPHNTAVPKQSLSQTMSDETQFSYWARHDQRGLQAAIDSGLEVSKFGNTAGKLVAIRVPKGTTIFEGKARGDISSVNQTGKPGEGLRHNPVGGGNQIVIQDVPSSWIVQP